jgi:hypothetical protein
LATSGDHELAVDRAGRDRGRDGAAGLPGFSTLWSPVVSLAEGWAGVRRVAAGRAARR